MTTSAAYISRFRFRVNYHDYTISTSCNARIDGSYTYLKYNWLVWYLFKTCRHTEIGREEFDFSN